MVTENIKQQDVHQNYANTNRWIKIGISNDAVAICTRKWNDIPNNKFSYIVDVRNNNDDDIHKQPLSKW